VCHVAGNGSLRMRVCQSLFIGRVWCLGVWMSQDVRVLRDCSELSRFGCCPASLFRDCHRVNDMNLLMFTTVWMYTAYFLGNTTKFVPSEAHVNIITPFDVPLANLLAWAHSSESIHLNSLKFAR